MKKTLSLFLCCILLAAFAPMAHAQDTLIEEAFATYVAPAAGEAFDFSAITVPLGANYTAEIKSVYYYDSGTGKYAYIADGDTVTAGARYSVRIRFYADKGYRFDDSVTVYTINGENKGSLVGTNMMETVFYPEDKAPTDPEPSKPTFRDRVATFFRDMRNRILYVIFFIRHLFGIKT